MIKNNNKLKLLCSSFNWKYAVSVLNLTIFWNQEAFAAENNERIVLAETAHSSSLAKNSLSGAAVSWNDLFSGKFKEIEQQVALECMKTGLQHFKAENYEQAFNSYKVLAQAGKIEAIKKCAEIMTQWAVEVYKKSPLEKTKVKNLIAECQKWNWMYFLKSIVDQLPNYCDKILEFSLNQALLVNTLKRGVEWNNYLVLLSNMTNLTQDYKKNKKCILIGICLQLINKTRSSDTYFGEDSSYHYNQFTWISSKLTEEVKESIVTLLYDNKETLKAHRTDDNIFPIHDVFKQRMEELVAGPLAVNNTLSFWGALYMQGDLGKDLTPQQRYHKAEQFFVRCPNDPEANCNLATLILERDIRANLTQKERDLQAEMLLLKAQDLPIAQLSLAAMYDDNRAGLEMSDRERWAKLESLCHKLVKSPENRIVGNHKLGLMYLHDCAGLHLSQEERYKRGVKFLEKSIMFPASQHNLAVAYQSGKAGGALSIEKRFAKAEELYIQCLTKFPMAKNNLANLYMNNQAGLNFPAEERYLKAQKLLLQCQEIPTAKLNLGLMYCHGQIDKHLSHEERCRLAEKLFEESIEGEPGSRFPLAYMYVHTDKNLQDINKMNYVLGCFETDYLTNEEKSRLHKILLMQKLKCLGGLDRGNYEEAFEKAHEAEILSGDTLALSEQFAVILQEDEEVHGNTELPPSLKESSSNRDIAPAFDRHVPSKENILHLKTKEIKGKVLLEGKERKNEKKHAQTLRNIKEIANQRSKDLIKDISSSSVQRKIVFDSPQVKKSYEMMLSDLIKGKKLEEIIKDILFYGHQTKGIGKPEPLKGQYQGFWSRRINQEHRIVYRVVGDQVIVYEAEGHYQKQK